MICDELLLIFVIIVSIVFWWISNRITNYIVIIGNNAQGYANNYSSHGDLLSSTYWFGIGANKCLLGLLAALNSILSFVDTLISTDSSYNDSFFKCVSSILNLTGVILPLVLLIASLLYLKKFRKLPISNKNNKSFWSIISPFQAYRDWFANISKSIDPNTNRVTQKCPYNNRK